MAVFDANGDGLNDVITSLNAHGFGLAWFEQKRDASGKISFVQHMISDDYSTPTPAESPSPSLMAPRSPTSMATASRFHRRQALLDPPRQLLRSRPLRSARPVLVPHRPEPESSGRRRVRPELIHNQSGVGSDVFAADINRMASWTSSRLRGSEHSSSGASARAIC